MVSRYGAGANGIRRKISSKISCGTRCAIRSSWGWIGPNIVVLVKYWQRLWIMVAVSCGMGMMRGGTGAGKDIIRVIGAYLVA